MIDLPKPTLGFSLHYNILMPILIFIFVRTRPLFEYAKNSYSSPLYSNPIVISSFMRLKLRKYLVLIYMKIDSLLKLATKLYFQEAMDVVRVFSQSKVSAFDFVHVFISVFSYF